MNILLNGQYKAIRVGQYVEANEESGEFILDTENCSLSKTVLVEICNKNKIQFSKKATQPDLVESIQEGVEGMDLPVSDTKPDSLKVREVVEALIEKGKDIEADEDDFLMAIIDSGVKFKYALKLFKQVCIDLGVAVTSKDRNELSRKILVGAGFEPNEYSEVSEMIDRIVKEVPATDSAQAYAQIRKYAKEMDIVLPKPDKKAAAGGFSAKIYEFMVKNPLSTKNEFTAWVVEDNEKDEKLAEKYWKIFEIGQKIAAATIALNDE